MFQTAKVRFGDFPCYNVSDAKHFRQFHPPLNMMYFLLHKLQMVYLVSMLCTLHTLMHLLGIVPYPHFDQTTLEHIYEKEKKFFHMPGEKLSNFDRPQ